MRSSAKNYPILGKPSTGGDTLVPTGTALTADEPYKAFTFRVRLRLRPCARYGEEEGLPLEPLEHVPNLLNVARRFGYLVQLNSHHLILGAL